MTSFNLKTNSDIATNYQKGLLPQRNLPGAFYQDTSCRSNLANFFLSSENRRILRKTENFSYEVTPLKDFSYTPQVQKQIKDWIKQLGWDFPISSVKTIFTKHIFNQVYVWRYQEKIVAFDVCYLNSELCHTAYVFFDPNFSRTGLPIRLVLQCVIDSQTAGQKYCYLGRYTEGSYKRTMPGFEYYQNGEWLKYSK
ncbi:hypothetical protein KBC75_03505 [Candidatus Shapirobacteria bacterium]|nr:hypothetical protein [Candidatus Shapirobacteria bacterium]